MVTIGQLNMVQSTNSQHSQPFLVISVCTQEEAMNGAVVIPDGAIVVVGCAQSDVLICN